MFVRFHGRSRTLAVAGLLLLSGVGRPASRPASAIAFGDLVGAELDAAGRLWLYATEPGPAGPTVLSMDDLVKMAHAVWTCGPFAFSLEFERVGRSPFRRQDVDIPTLAARLARASDPLAQYIRGRLSPRTRQLLDRYRRSLEPDRELRRLEEPLVAGLNTLLEDPGLYEPRRFAAVTLADDTQAALAVLSGARALRRRNRLLLADAFPQELGADIGDHYQMRYMPFSLEPRLRRILHQTSVERTFLITDRAMKELARCDPDLRDLDIGACKLWLTGEELVEAESTGARKSGRGSEVTFFNLVLTPQFATPQRVGWEGAALVVEAASRTSGVGPSRAAQAFAANLTRRMDSLLAHPRLGPEFRRLHALMVLGRVFGWAKDNGFPAGLRWFESYQAEVHRLERVPIARDLLVAGGSGRPRGLVLLGGIRLNAGLYAGGPALTPARLALEAVTLDGRRLLRFDISHALGSTRR
jgi:hypothetical protein